MSVKIDKQRCRGCAQCVNVCLIDAIVMKDRIAVVDEQSCIACGSCVAACPADAIVLEA